MNQFDLQKKQLQGLAKKLLQTEDYNAQIKAMNIHLQDTLSETQRQKNEVVNFPEILNRKNRYFDDFYE